MVKLGIAGTVRHFLGLFNLTEFERDLIGKLRDSVDQTTREILDDQISRFNRVQRILVDDDRIGSGSTTFYWVRFGKSLIDRFPKRIPQISDAREYTFFRCVARDSTNNDIRVDYQAVYGVFVNLEYWSDKRRWYPKGRYSFIKVENLLPNAAVGTLGTAAAS
jgi:hypothetical protein